MEKERYRSFNSYLRETFKERVQRIPLDAGLGCPNRVSPLKGGCIYCGPLGSGTGKSLKGVPISIQMKEGIEWARKKYKANKFIAYFQSYTNTNAPLAKLRSLIEEALPFNGVVGLFISTRPDSINKDVLELISEYKKDYLVWIELGLQSIHEKTLMLIRRGHGLKEFNEGYFMVKSYGVPVCTHIIMGLPYETEEMILETVAYLADLKTDGIKIHNLYILEGTELWQMYYDYHFSLLTQPQYVKLVVKALELLPPDTVIMRLTGDPPHNMRFEPKWASQKTQTLKMIHETLLRLDTWQGKRWKGF